MTGPVAVADAAEGRAPAVVAAARWLDSNPHLAAEETIVADVFRRAALDLLAAVPVDTPELALALRSLTSAKDEAVRASLSGRGA